MGCQTFCCRLLVRLDSDEQIECGQATKRFVDKDPADGYCIHLDRRRYTCTAWAIRPRICREYDCNTDPLLQVALRYPFRNIAELVTTAEHVDLVDTDRVAIPTTTSNSDSAGSEDFADAPRKLETP